MSSWLLGSGNGAPGDFRPNRISTGLFPLIAGVIGVGLAVLFYLRVLAAPNKSRTGDDAITKKVRGWSMEVGGGGGGHG